MSTKLTPGMSWADDESDNDEVVVNDMPDKLAPVDEIKEKAEVGEDELEISPGESLFIAFIGNVSHDIGPQRVGDYFFRLGCTVKDVCQKLGIKSVFRIEFSDGDSLSIALSQDKKKLSGRPLRISLEERDVLPPQRHGGNGDNHRGKESPRDVPRFNDKHEMSRNHGRNFDVALNRPAAHAKDAPSKSISTETRHMPSTKSGTEDHTTSNSADQVPSPVERPKLSLLPRSSSMPVHGAPPSRPASIFGTGKPRDELSIETLQHEKKVIESRLDGPTEPKSSVANIPEEKTLLETAAEKAPPELSGTLLKPPFSDPAQKTRPTAKGGRRNVKNTEPSSEIRGKSHTSTELDSSVSNAQSNPARKDLRAVKGNAAYTTGQGSDRSQTKRPSHHIASTKGAKSYPYDSTNNTQKVNGNGSNRHAEPDEIKKQPTPDQQKTNENPNRGENIGISKTRNKASSGQKRDGEISAKDKGIVNAFAPLDLDDDSD